MGNVLKYRSPLMDCREKLTAVPRQTRSKNMMVGAFNDGDGIDLHKSELTDQIRYGSRGSDTEGLSAEDVRREKKSARGLSGYNLQALHVNTKRGE